MRKLTNEDFINRSVKVLGDLYDYSEAHYVDAHTHVKIICKLHNELFEQTPNNHYRGKKACPECNPNIPRSDAKFAKCAIEKHGNVYDYSEAHHVGNKIKLKIICKTHGPLWQKPLHHLLGKGCPECGGRSRGNTARFIKRSQEEHGAGTYDYSESHYEYCDKKVKIICKTHGPFWQTPSNHQSGNGCPTCSESKLERTAAKILTDMGITFTREKTYDECKNKKCLPFDFQIFLPGSGYEALIEMDGEQHFEAVECFGGEDVFERTQKHDNIKNEFAINQKKPLLRIPYTFSYEQIQNRIKNFIELNKDAHLGDVHHGLYFI